MSGTLVKTVGFEWMLFGIALLNFVYAPLLIMLKSPPTKEEKKVGIYVLVIGIVTASKITDKNKNASSVYCWD